MKAMTLTSVNGERQIKQHIFIEDKKGAISLCKRIRPSNDGDGIASLNTLSNLFENLDIGRCCKNCLKVLTENKEDRTEVAN